VHKHFKRNKNSWLGFASLHIITHYFSPLIAALYVQESMSPDNQIVFKSLIGYGSFFFIIWLVLSMVLIFTGKK
ncbi:MAG: hypothetical protein ACTH36_11385, partial [Pseudoalteromonas nigrifaciens]